MEEILFEVKENIAFITLNRPEKMNAFNRKMAFLMQRRLDDCAADETVRAVYLTGSGRAFCAGQDLSELTGADAPGFDSILRDHYNPIVTRIRNLDKPVVCAVNGVAAGAGANIALGCDIVVASESAAFIQAFARIGLIPDSGGTFTLPRLVGWQRATALMMLGDKVTAADAEKYGMLYKVFPNDIFVKASTQIATTLAALPTKALAFTKQALKASFHNSFEEQLQAEDKLQFAAANTSDYREGVQSFLEKRTPVFKGM